MPNDDAKAHPDISVTDELDPGDVAVITDGLRAYDLSQTGYYDFRPLAVFVRDPQTGKVVGGLHGRSEFGLVYVAWLFLPEDLRRLGIGSRVLAMAEEEGRRRGCTRIALTTLSIEAPGFYQKQGYDIAATIDCDPPGLTRYYMMKRLASLGGRIRRHYSLKCAAWGGSQWALPIALQSRKIWRKPRASFNSRLTRCVSAMAGSPGRRHLRSPFRNSAWREIPPGSGSR
jgi:GNAT superfamily N-acetyltransferase